MHLIFLSLIISFIFGQQSSISAHSAPLILETSPDFSTPFDTEFTQVVLAEPHFDNFYWENTSKVKVFEDQKIQIAANFQIQKKSILEKAKNQISKIKKSKLSEANLEENLEKSSVKLVPNQNFENLQEVVTKKYQTQILETSLENSLETNLQNLQHSSQLTAVLGFEDAENSSDPTSTLRIISPIESKNSTQNSLPKTPISFDSVVVTPKIETVISSQNSVKSSDLTTMIIQKCQELGCDSAKMLKVVQCESGGRNVSSPGGHVGPFQFTSKTFYAFAKQYGLQNVDIWNMSDQVEVAARMFAKGLGRQHWSCF